MTLGMIFDKSHDSSSCDIHDGFPSILCSDRYKMEDELPFGLLRLRKMGWWKSSRYR